MSLATQEHPKANYLFVWFSYLTVKMKAFRIDIDLMWISETSWAIFICNVYFTIDDVFLLSNGTLKPQIVPTQVVPPWNSAKNFLIELPQIVPLYLKMIWNTVKINTNTRLKTFWTAFFLHGIFVLS